MVRVKTQAIVALDYHSLDDALSLVRTLGDLCRFYKIGSGLFTAAGPTAVAAVRELGCDVFLDLKFHDIPSTVRAAVRGAAAHGVRLVTVHASGGRMMLEAAIAGANAGGRCGVLAVTVLTSLDAETLGRAWGRRPPPNVGEEVMRLAALAAEAGAEGIVCSGQEAPGVRARYGDRLALVIPGVRFADGTADDQVRVVTPRAARDAGAAYVVVGRAVTAAPDPRAAMAAVAADLASA